MTEWTEFGYHPRKKPRQDYMDDNVQWAEFLKQTFYPEISNLNLKVKVLWNLYCFRIFVTKEEI